MQNSVFECILDWSQYETIKSELMEIIDKGMDSIRFYNLGNKFKNSLFSCGKKTDYNLYDNLII